jgi:hypothetical protein
MNNFRDKLKLPAAGDRLVSALNNVGNYGYYWTSLSDASYADYARNLNFSSGYPVPGRRLNRHYGFLLRCFKDL